VLLISVSSKALDFEKYLINPPQLLTVTENSIGIDKSIARNMLSAIQLTILSQNKGKSAYYGTGSSKKVILSLKIDTIRLKPQQYTLTILPGDIVLAGHDNAALFYGKQTLIQLLSFMIKEKKDLPCLKISDWPNFEKRGYMLDISRDKVPTMQSLYQLIDQLAQWKINELQLYTEHTFAYKNHPIVWTNASPLTSEEVKQLDLYCKERFIDLVPNQNSFGHMENWLKHDEYLPLAECPTDCNTIWGKRNRTILDPTNPKSLALMEELYNELLPNFTSRYFNIGGDETVELCEGRSKETCEKTGKGKVYLNYLLKLNEAANKNGKLAQFWGDIILNHAELINEIPKNMTALVWGYEDTYPFDKNLPPFKKAGLPFYVCPGTSSWRSVIGKNQNAFINLRNAAIEGKKNAAKGYLNTDWGDQGHFQPFAIVYPTLLLGAGYSWNYSEAALKNLEFQLNQYVYKDETSNMAKAILKLGNAYLKAGIPNGNANAFHLMLQRFKWTMQGNDQTKKMTIAGFNATKQEINAALKILDNAHPKSLDADILLAETRLASALAIHAVNLGIARLKAKDYETKNISPSDKRMLIDELTAIIKEHRKLWTVRNRPGGLDDSAGRLEELLSYYKAVND
jgi:hypothetical protein